MLIQLVTPEIKVSKSKMQSYLYNGLKQARNNTATALNKVKEKIN